MDPKKEGRRLATCTANTFSQNRLPFVIQSPMVLVLDSKSLEEGQIIGVLQEGDLLGASLLEFPWVMLPESSFVRHPKMRQGRIKLLRSGWVISQHPQYGELLHALSMDQVRKLFSEEAFSKLPMVKDAGATPNRPVRLDEEAYTQPEPAPEPKATPKASPTSPPAPSKAARSPKAAAAPEPLPKRSQELASPQEKRQGRSEASLVLGVPPRPWSAPQAAAPKAAPKEAPKASSLSSTLAKLPKQARASPESCQRHLQMCACEHWKVIHTFVFVRSEASLEGEPLAVLREGNLLCSALLEGRSGDQKWAKLGGQAKVWPQIASECPDFVALGHESIYVLIHKTDVGDLIRLVPSQVSSPSKGEFQRQLSGSSTRPPEDLSKLDHWVVLQACRIALKRGEESEDDILLEEGDLLRTVDHGMARIFRDSEVRWLHVPMGSQAYRAPDQLPVFPGSFQKTGYVKLEFAGVSYLRPHQAVESGTCITELSSYGEPWVVEHEQVVVRRGPSTSEAPLGVMLKGDVVGVRRRSKDWVELVQDCEVRFKKRESLDQSITAVNPLRKHKEGKLQSKMDGLVKAYMLVEHPSYGQLLRRARKRKGGLASGCVLSEARLKMYQEVVELCHRRIYKENLDSLWDGEVEKLPTLESIEAKLFEDVEVLHVTIDGRFTGGALVKELSVRARHVEGSSNLNLSAAGGDTEILGTTTVSYIDSMASEPLTKSGKVMWDFIVGMSVICVACHSILRQKTVDFWQARGMRKMDPSSEKDCTAFRQLVMVHTMGKVICELKDLQEALPKSKLPLFVWVPSRFTEEDQTLHENYVFRPDDSTDVMS